MVFIYLHRKMKKSKGTGVFPSLFFTTTMSTDSQIETAKSFLLPLLEDDVFLVDIRIKPTNNIKIYLDADNGLGIEKCIKINRTLYKVMEEMEVYPDGNFSLEVSSPGIDEPLKLHRQYVKNTGRNVEVIHGAEDKISSGKLVGVDENSISVETVTGKGKKAVTELVEIPFSDIKQTLVTIQF